MWLQKSCECNVDRPSQILRFFFIWCWLVPHPITMHWDLLDGWRHSIIMIMLMLVTVPKCCVFIYGNLIREYKRMWIISKKSHVKSGMWYKSHVGLGQHDTINCNWMVPKVVFTSWTLTLSNSFFFNGSVVFHTFIIVHSKPFWWVKRLCIYNHVSIGKHDFECLVVIVF